MTTKTRKPNNQKKQAQAKKSEQQQQRHDEDRKVVAVANEHHKNNNTDEDDDDDAGSVNSDAAIAVPEAHMARPRRKRSNGSRSKRIARKLSFGAPSKAALAVLSDASVAENDEQSLKADKEAAALLVQQQKQSKPKAQQQERSSRNVNKKKQQPTAAGGGERGIGPAATARTTTAAAAAAAGQQATGQLHQIRRTRTLENQSIKAAIDVSKLRLQQCGMMPGGGKSSAAAGRGGAATASAPVNNNKKNKNVQAANKKPLRAASCGAMVVSAAHVAVPESTLDHRDAEDDQVADAMTDDGFDYGDDDGSDIAVTVPKQQQRDRDNNNHSRRNMMSMSMSHGSGGGSRRHRLHGTASKAAQAVLASLDDSCRQELMTVNDGRDIESLLPHEQQGFGGAPKGGEEQSHGSSKRARRSISGRLERTVEAIMDSSFGRAASAGRSRLSKDSGASKDGSSGGDEVSSLQRRKMLRQQRKINSRRSIRSSKAGSFAPSEEDNNENNDEGNNNKRKNLKKEASYKRKHKTSEKMSTYTGTSRTGSFSDVDVDLEEYEEGRYSRRGSYTDLVIDETRSVRSATSRATLASKSTHRTLKEIRSEKNLPIMNHPDVLAASNAASNSRRSWSVWTLVIIAITAMIGFGVGFIVPLVQKSKVVTTDAMTQSPQKPSLPPLDPDAVNPFGDYGMEQWNNQGQGPITIHTVPPDGNTNFIPPVVSGSEQQEEEEEEEERPEGGGNNPESEEDSIFPIIDVWKLFGTQEKVRVPQASVNYLSTSFRKDHLEEAARLFVQGTIQRNIRRPKVLIEKEAKATVNGGDGDLEEEMVIPFFDTPRLSFDGEMPYPTTSGSRSTDKYPQGDAARWEDILTKLGIQESDTLQWDQDQSVLYVARGKHIEVIDTKTGGVRATIKLPKQPSPSAEENLLLMRDSWLIDTESDGWKPAPPEPYVEQLLLTTDKDYLVVVMSDYTHVHQAKVKPLLKESRVTQLFTYRLTHTDNVTQYELIGDDPHLIHGRLLYAAQATSNQHIHIVTTSGIDTARFLQDPLERLYYPDRHDNVYVDHVLDAARDKYVPLYARRLIDEIDDLEGELKLLPLTQWITGDGATTEEERQLENLLTAQEHLQGLVIVTSFSIVQTNDPTTTATLRQAGTSTTMTSLSTAAVSTAVLGPASMQVIGSTDTHLAVSVPGYMWHNDAQNGKVLQEATHVMQWELGTLSVAGSSNRAATRFQSMGSVPGRLVQAPRQSTHRNHDDLSLATILTSQWKVGLAGTTQPMVESLVHKSYLHVLHQTTLQHRAGSPLELFKGEPALLSSVTYTDDVAYAFPLSPKSIDSAKKAGIQAVKLPTYPEDRSDNSVQLSGSISPVPQGFSPHLHELHSPGGKKLIMSIGQNATDSGLSNKWMLTVWDASDPMRPTELARRNLEEENTITTWKPKTYRVTPHGLVILPMTVEYLVTDAQTQNMKGFLVLHVTATEVKDHTDVEIRELTRVPHSSVVMSAGECQPGEGGCGLEGKSLFGTAEGGSPLLVTIEGATAKLTTLELEETHQNKNDAQSVTLPLP